MFTLNKRLNVIFRDRFQAGLSRIPDALQEDTNCSQGTGIGPRSKVPPIHAPDIFLDVLPARQLPAGKAIQCPVKRFRFLCVLGIKYLAGFSYIDFG